MKKEKATFAASKAKDVVNDILPGEEAKKSDNVNRALKKVTKADDMVSHAKKKLEEA